MLRDKLVRSYKSREEDRMEQQREKVRKAVQGKVKLLIPASCSQDKDSVVPVIKTSKQCSKMDSIN